MIILYFKNSGQFLCLQIWLYTVGMGLPDSLLGSHLIYAHFSWVTGGSRTEELAPCLVFQVYQRVETQFLASPTWKMWQSSACVNSIREKKTHELASETLCCDTSSSFPQLKYSVEGWQKRALETSTVFLPWVSSQTGVIHCASYLCNKLLFPLCKQNVRGSLPLGLCGCWCGHARWQKTASAEGHIILRGAAARGGVWLLPEVRLPAARNKSLSGQRSLRVTYRGAVPLDIPHHGR